MAAPSEGPAGPIAQRLGPGQLACLAALIGAGIALRFVRIERSYWFDELYTMGQMGAPSLRLLLIETFKDPNNPSLFSVLCYGWSHLFGYSEIGSRSLSVLCSVLLLATPWIARTALGRTEKWLASALLALWYLPIRYAQETRVYSLLLLLGAICLFAHLENIVAPTRARRVALHSSLIALALAHLFGVLLALSFLASMWLYARGVRQRVGLAVYALVLAAAGTVPLVLQGILTYAGGRFWIPFTVSWLLLQAILVVTPVGAAVLLCALVGARSRGRKSAWRSPLTQALLPFLLMILGSLVLSLNTPIIIARNLICVVPAMALLASVGLQTVMRGRMAAAVLALLGLMGVQSALGEYLWVGYNREDFRAVAALSVSSNTPICYVVAPGETARLGPLYGFYVDKIFRRRDLTPKLFDADTLGASAVPDSCPLWSVLHAPGFSFRSHPAFAHCVPADARSGIPADTVVSCGAARVSGAAGTPR